MKQKKKKIRIYNRTSISINASKKKERMPAELTDDHQQYQKNIN